MNANDKRAKQYAAKELEKQTTKKLRLSPYPPLIFHFSWLKFHTEPESHTTNDAAEVLEVFHSMMEVVCERATAVIYIN